VTGETPLQVPRRTYEPRCTRSFLRKAGLVVTAPVAMLGVGFATTYIMRTFTSPLMPTALAAILIMSVWAWAFSRRGPIEEAWLRRRRRRAAALPGEPWLGDHPWDPSGVNGLEPLEGRSTGVGWFLAVWVLGPAVVVGPWLTLSIVGVVATWKAWGIWKRLGRGRGRVSFVRFPHFTGETVELHFGMNPGGATFLRGRFVLRRIQEVDAAWHVGGPRRTQTFAQECTLDDGVLPGPDADVRLRFDVPADAGGTSLASRLPSYWELAVVGETTKGAFDETFLVPVYERPAPPRP
jgi:hypothetical protein